MTLNTAETVRLFGFDRTAYGNLNRNNGKRKWYKELKEQRARYALMLNEKTIV
jgi:hypothetical protein